MNRDLARRVRTAVAELTRVGYWSVSPQTTSEALVQQAMDLLEEGVSTRLAEFIQRRYSMR